MERPEMPRDEVRFENRYLYTECTVYAAFRKLVPVWKRLLYGFWILFGAAVIATAYMRRTESAFLGWVLLATGIAGMFVPRLNARYAVRNNRRLMNGATPEVVVRYTDAEIVANEAKNEVHYAYGQLTRVRSTRRLWILQLGPRMALVVDKEGFTRGERERFPDFIRAKCPGLKGKFA